MNAVDNFLNGANPLAGDYSRSHVGTRIMLTGHMFQPCPDISLLGQEEAWANMASYGEERWHPVFEKANQIRSGFAKMLNCADERIALASSIHDLVIRFISALPLRQRKKIITTDSEPPSVARQLNRLIDDGIELIRIPMQPANSIIERIAAQLDDNTAAVLISSVFFETGEIALELDTLGPQCANLGIELFVNAHQSVNVDYLDLNDLNLETAFVASGTSTYCQMGDGLCFMHVPDRCQLRPLIAGWFGSHDPVTGDPAALPFKYGEDYRRFNGSTVDPTSYFRAVKVLEYFEEKQLNAEFLHELNHAQLGQIVTQFHARDFDPDIIQLHRDVEYLGGFLAFSSPYAVKLAQIMRDHGVHTDAGGQLLRFGPAPYLSVEQLDDAIEALAEAIEHLAYD